MLIAPRKKVIVEPLDPPDYIGSIYVPDQAAPRVTQGLVKYIGPDCDLETYSGLKIGDHILFGGYDGTLTYIEGEGKLIILHEDTIKAILEDDPIDIVGLYFKSNNGEYFTATYEQALFLCAKSLSKRMRITKWRDPLQDRPKHEEYDNQK